MELILNGQRVWGGDGIQNVLADDLLPLADNTYSLGSAALGWKGIYTPNLLLRELDSNTLYLRDAIDSADRNLRLSTLYFGIMTAVIAGTSAITTRDADANLLLLKARASGVGLVEVARLQGAADPYFSMGGSQEFKFTNAGLMGLFGATAVGQRAHIVDADGTLADITTKFNQLLLDLETLGTHAAV
jgi:hypothetical protein